MADWLHGKDGQTLMIHDGDCFRDSNGHVVAWIKGANV